MPTVVYDPASDNHGYGYGFSVETRLGTKVRFAPTLNPGIPAADIGYYDNEWAALKLCTGLTAKPPPFVVMVQFGQIEELAPPLIRRGKFFAEPPLIVIDDTASWYAHEALHYLLYKALGDLDSAHTSPLWLRCAGHPT